MRLRQSTPALPPPPPADAVATRLATLTRITPRPAPTPPPRPAPLAHSDVSTRIARVSPLQPPPLPQPSACTLAQRLRWARQTAGLSRQTLAARAEVDVATLAALEAGRPPRRRAATALARLAGPLGVSPAWLLTGHDTPSTP